jgi:hypothetical protein
MVAPDKKGSSTDASELQTPQVEEPTPTETCANASTSTSTGETYVSTFVKDPTVEKEIIRLGRCYDDPPIVFGWNDVGLEEFHNKAVAYALQPGAVLPPPQINGGVNLVEARRNCATSIQQLKVWILEYLRAQQSNNPPVIVGETACLACSQNQFGHAIAHVATLLHEPWFVAVLALGQPLAQPLGSLWHPRPRVVSGLLDQLHIPGVLWA